MREHLYSGKRIDNGERIEGDLLHPDTEIGIGYSIETLDKSAKNNCHEVIEETICEYTGWLDKNKNRIFEGNIVKYAFKKNKARMIGKVIFKRGSFLLDNGYIEVPFDDVYDLKVVGNIYDNPELLRAQ